VTRAGTVPAVRRLGAICCGTTTAQSDGGLFFRLANRYYDAGVLPLR
jgi:hypothetical protein